MLNFRSDLAYERRNIYRKANNIEDEIEGIETQEEIISNNINIYRVKILNEQGENAIGKKKGNYITIDIKNLEIAEEEEIIKVSKILTKELKKLINSFIKPKEDILVVGLRKFICNS